MNKIESCNILNKLGVGEIIICNKDTKGKFQPINEFIGKSIIGIGGGENKTYIIEEKDRISSIVRSIQTREDFKNLEDKEVANNIHTIKSTNENYNEDNDIESIDENEKLENERVTQIIQIVKGKHQLLKLLVNGEVYASGESYFGVVGLGGAASSDIPKLIPNLSNIKVKQIACGTNHSMALSVEGDLYSWGMGFEGQLGLTNKYKVASSPRYVKSFYKKPIKFIACGTNNSFCILEENSYLYGWGENKLGQLGLGKIQNVEKPTLITYEDFEDCDNLDNSFNEQELSENKIRNIIVKPLKAKFLSAGYAHTAVVSNDGPLFTMGLNIYGQLGLGHTETTFYPNKVLYDEDNNPLGKVTKVGCNVTGTFIIVEGGNLYSCGSGDIGHGEIDLIKLPKKIYDQRIYSEIFCNNDSIVCFCPLKIISVSPNFGPSTGNTILSIIGSALKEFPNLSVRFDFEGYSKEVKANFDKLSKTIFVKTPNFIDIAPNLTLPAKAKIWVTLDGVNSKDYKEDFFIYSNSIRKPTSISPKCGPISGGNEAEIQINLDGIDSKKYLFLLTVGFQAKQNTIETSEKKRTTNKLNKENSKIDNDNSKISKISKNSDDKSNMGGLMSNIDNIKENNQLDINPMDINPSNCQNNLNNWTCTLGTYENGVIKCVIPKIDNYNPNCSEYFVDVSMNGQQFSGYPLTYKFYDIQFKGIDPKLSPINGGTKIKIHGDGFFDTSTKKAKIISNYGERLCDIQWDRNDKSFQFVTNPLGWLTDNEEIIKDIDPVELYEKMQFDIYITLNGIHYMLADSYRYYDVKLLRISYIQFPDKTNFEQRLKMIKMEEPLTLEEKIAVGFVPNNIEDKKKKEELTKKILLEDEMIKTMARRPYASLYLYGNFFPKFENKNNVRIL